MKSTKRKESVGASFVVLVSHWKQLQLKIGGFPFHPPCICIQFYGTLYFCHFSCICSTKYRLFFQRYEKIKCSLDRINIDLMKQLIISNLMGSDLKDKSHPCFKQLRGPGHLFLRYFLEPYIGWAWWSGCPSSPFCLPFFLLSMAWLLVISIFLFDRQFSLTICRLDDTTNQRTGSWRGRSIVGISVRAEKWTSLSN